MSSRHNEGGYQQSKKDRYDDYNDPGTPDDPKLVPMGRKENSGKGAGGETYDMAPEGDYFKDE